MAYTSLGFLGFLVLVAVVYYLVPKKFQWAVLLVASYAFYLFSGIEQIAFIMATTLITYLAGRIMQNVRDDYKSQLAKLPKDTPKETKQELKKKTNNKIRNIQFASVILDLLILVVVKYLNFAVENINSIFTVFHYDAKLPLVNIIVPLGISFYTFMSMGYLIDVGRGRYEAEKHLGKFALFVSFFPSIVQGPISRFDDVGKQLGAEHKFDYNNFKFGAQLMLWGFFKKMVIADRAFPAVSAIFSADKYLEYNGSIYFFGMLMYALQIYCDFSGGIDIARGAAQMLGINLPLNFERPYFSMSVAEYWRRWHITLGAWMREYVFFPIMLSKPVTKISKFFRQKGKKQVAKLVPSVITPFVVFFLIGVWHVAEWKYIAFGLYNATIVASSVALAPTFKKIIAKFNINTDTFSWKLFCIVRTFLVLGVSKILVKAPSLTAALHMVKSIFTQVDLDFIFGFDGKIFELGIDEKNMFVLFVATLVLLFVSVLQENGMKIRETIAKQNIVFRWGIYLIALIVVLVFGIYGPMYNAADFIYQAY